MTEALPEDDQAWLRDPLPGEPGHEDTPFPPPPLPPGWEDEA